MVDFFFFFYARGAKTTRRAPRAQRAAAGTVGAGRGAPDWGDVLVAEPFDVALDAAGRPARARVTACTSPCPIAAMIAGAPADCCGPQ